MAATKPRVAEKKQRPPSSVLGSHISGSIAASRAGFIRCRRRPRPSNEPCMRHCGMRACHTEESRAAEPSLLRVGSLLASKVLGLCVSMAEVMASQLSFHCAYLLRQ